VHTKLDYQAALIDQNRLFTETVLSAQPETPIPTCPGWSMLQLMRHVGRSERWAAHILRTGADISLDPRSVANGRPPDNRDGARDWLLAGPQVLLEAVAHIGGRDVSVTTFVGPRPAQWWIRRFLHETTVHRADAVLAVTEEFDLEPAVAADGIDEWLERLTERSWKDNLPIERGRTVTLIANDIEAVWSMESLGNSLRLSRGSTTSPSGVQLSGSATDLLLILMRRRGVEETRCRVEGDPNSLATFLGRTPYVALGTR
jgi:uncharacterized protein (TIGR03083 family)